MPADTSASPSGLVVVSLSHRDAPPEVRWRLFVDEPDYVHLLADARAAGLEQALVLATCERFEVATLTADPHRCEATIAGLVRDWARPDDADGLVRDLSVMRGEIALRHLFAVAAALESQVLGEPQILGQLRRGHEVARTAGLVGPQLEAVLRAAYTVARRVRTETGLAQHPVSIAAAAIKVAGQVLGDLRRAAALVVGLGEMGEIMAGQLRDAEVRALMLVHPQERRAESVAGRIGAHVRSWDELELALGESDVVVTALGEGHYIVREEMMRRVLRKRRQRPVFIMDTGVPGDVEPAVGTFDPAFVYDLGDLERIAQQGKAKREAAALDAWRIVDQELDAFRRRLRDRHAETAQVALRRHAEAIRCEVLASGKLDADAATRLLLKRLLHGPSEALRAASSDPDMRAELERSLERLFGIDLREAGRAKDEEDET